MKKVLRKLRMDERERSVLTRLSSSLRIWLG